MLTNYIYVNSSDHQTTLRVVIILFINEEIEVQGGESAQCLLGH